MNKLNKSLSLAVCLHLSLGLCLFFYFENNKRINTHSKVSVFHVYKVPSPLTPATVRPRETRTRRLEGPQARIENTRQMPTTVRPRETRMRRLEGPQTSEGKLSPLIKIIESDIQQHKYYPLAALQEHQQGNVTIAFELHPNGQITNVHVVKSSHVTILDNAAINAVTSAGPIPMAKKYLHHDGQIKIRLRYQLT